MNSNELLNVKEDIVFSQEHFITDVNHSRFLPWLGEYYCYFSSTHSEEIDKPKQENLSGMNEEEKELFKIMPAKDHIFCGKMKIFQTSENLCQVSLEFMSDRKNDNIKRYRGTLALSKEYMAGFISLYHTDRGEASYIVIESPDSGQLMCRMAMTLTLSSIDRHRRACVEKMLITKKFIPENTAAYEAMKAFLLMNDSYIWITKEKYTQLLEELKSSNNAELQKFAKDFPSLTALKSANKAIKADQFAQIHESAIAHWGELTDAGRDMLIVLMRKYSISDWYYKANNENAKEILYLIEKKKDSSLLNDSNMFD